MNMQVNKKALVSVFVSLLLLNSVSYTQLQFKDNSVFAPVALGAIKLIHNEKGFHVLQDGQQHLVKNYWLDTTLRTLNNQPQKLKLFQENDNYIKVKKLSDGEFSLEAHARGKGGGPLAGIAAAVSVRAVGYGALITGIVYDPALIFHAGEIATAIEHTANMATIYATAAPIP